MLTQPPDKKDNPLKVNVPAEEGQLSLMFTRGGARVGAGRKAMGETRKVSLTLASELWSQMDKQCEVHGCSRSEWLRGVIEQALAAKPEPEQL